MKFNTEPIEDSRFSYLKKNRDISYHTQLNIFKAAIDDKIYIDLLYRTRLYPENRSWKRWIDGEGGKLIYENGIIKTKFKNNNFQFTSDLLYKATLQEIINQSIWIIKDFSTMILLGKDERIRVFKNNLRINCFEISLEKLINYIEVLNVKLEKPFVSKKI